MRDFLILSLSLTKLKKYINIKRYIEYFVLLKTNGGYHENYFGDFGFFGNFYGDMYHCFGVYRIFFGKRN